MHDSLCYLKMGLPHAYAVLPWHQSQPGAELTTIGEVMTMTNGAGQRRGRDRTHAGQAHELLCSCVSLGQTGNVLIVLRDTSRRDA